MRYEARAHSERKPGFQVEVSGPAGYSTDAIKVFSGINTTLFAAALVLVLVLLVLIYRSPVFWIIPILSVVAAEQLLRAAGYALTEVGVTVNGQTAGIALILVFGAGTDYALLLVARYREELRRNESTYQAMRLALAGAAPAIVASGGTVVAALLVVTLAEVNSTAGLGPLSAVGVGLAMISSLTLLPALLLIGGRRAFWPFVPHTGGLGADPTHGWWRRLGDRIARRPRATWSGSLSILVILAAGLVTFNTDLTTADSFRGEPEAVSGQQLISQSFPAGSNAPTVVIVPDEARVAAVAKAARGVPGVAEVSSRTEQGPPGTKLSVTLEADPYSTRAFDAIDPLRTVVRRAGGSEVTVGGPTAEEHDLRAASDRDNKLLVPLILAVVLVILIILLRALIAPLLLIATVVASYLAALGASSVIFTKLFGFAGTDPSCPLLAFLFLVALGVGLQHLPDGPRPRGSTAPRHPRGHAARARRHRRRHHLSGHSARRHLPRARRAPARSPDRDRLRRRPRRPARHHPRPKRARARTRARPRRANLVAVTPLLRITSLAPLVTAHCRSLAT